MTPEAEGEAAAEFAIELHNGLHDLSFPKCPNISDLARQTRMVIGCLEMIDSNTKESWEAVLLRALEEAFEMGVKSKMSDEEVEAMASVLAGDHVPEVADENIKKVLHQIKAYGIKLDLESSLRAMLGLNWCVQQRFLCNDHMHLVVRSCLLCGAHERSYPPIDEICDRSFFRNFCQRHSVCGGLRYPDEDSDDDQG